MIVGIAKIVPRQIESASYMVTKLRQKGNERTVEDAKEWCRLCIKKRLEMDSLSGDLDKIDYKVEEIWESVPKFKITATLEI